MVTLPFTTRASRATPDSIENINLLDRLELFNFLNKVSGSALDKFNDFLLPFTEEFQQQETERLEGMVETYGEEFYSFTDQDYYEHDVATYGQEEVDQWHENIEFDEEGRINWDTFVEGTPEEEVWVAQENELIPDSTEEEIFIESEEVFDLIVEDEAFEDLKRNMT